MNGTTRQQGTTIHMPPVLPVTRALLIACAAGFLLMAAAPRFALEHLALHPDVFRPWQLVTAVFLHLDAFHLLFNALALWMFGAEVEGVLGARRYLSFCALCAVGANLTWQLAALVGASSAPVLGISGLVFGLLFAYGWFFPNRVILAFFIFPMRARTFVWIFGGLELWFLLTSPGSTVAHLVHVAGAVIAALFLTKGGGLAKEVERAWTRFDLWRRTRHLRVIQGRKEAGPFRHDEDDEPRPPALN